jgi:prepilin-type N-terminal cleavage/methylation domain-containing protein/prepilin-type processing-associated H-X9-DG protein
MLDRLTERKLMETTIVFRRRIRGYGFTLIELLVVVAIIAVLISILLPAMGAAREQAKQVVCGSNLHSIGQAVASCSTENKGYGPGWDDGEPSIGHQEFMLTWIDVLFDNDYLGDWKVGICPSDRYPDEVTEARGEWWNFRFVRNIGAGEQPRGGVRTSIAINSHMSYNFNQDKFQGQPARQIYAMDGWWTWFGALGAHWLMGPRVGQYPPPMNWPHWEANMVGWRHGREYRAMTLFLDGHVSPITPRVPRSLGDLRDRADGLRFLPR